jgi:hypothetical protein
MLVLTLLGAGACGDDSTSIQDEAGTYALVSVNGQPLPFSLTTLLGPVVVQNASLQIGSASSASAYAATISGLLGGQPGTLFSDAGTYSRSGSTLTFSSTTSAGLVLVGTASGNSVIITIPGAAVGAAGNLALDFRK